MGGDTEDVSVQRLSSAWAYAAYVMVFLLFCNCRKKVSHHK